MKFHSMAEVVPDKDGVVIVNSLSKNFGVSGWRIGYVIADRVASRTNKTEPTSDNLRTNNFVHVCRETLQ